MPVCVNMSVHVYVYVYVYVCVCVCVPAYLFLYMHVWQMHMCIQTYMTKYVCMCAHELCTHHLYQGWYSINKPHTHTHTHTHSLATVSSGYTVKDCCVFTSHQAHYHITVVWMQLLCT